jgi:LysM repeat protein
MSDFFEKTSAAMKPTLLIATLTMGLALPKASAATELETLRARCAEQEQQIKDLQAQLQKLQPATSEAAARSTPAATTEAARIYVVKPGDFLERIARKTNCSAAAIAKANNMKPTKMLHPGQKLKLPAGTSNQATTSPAPSAPSSLAGKTHTIKQGETYYSLSRKYGISVDSLIAANPHAKAPALRPGLVIRLSAAPAQPSKAPAATASTPAPSTKPVPAPSPTPKPTPKPTAPAEMPKETAKTPPASSPQEPAAPAAPEKKIRSVTIDSEMTYAEFAAKHGTDTDRLNDLNGLDLTSTTVLAKGSELYVPAQP